MNRLLASAAASAYLRACNRVGAHPVLRGRPYIENYGRLELGDRFQLDSRPVQSHLVTGANGHLTIGDDVHIAFGAAIACHGRIRIGDRASIGSFAMIVDTDFHDLVSREDTAEPGAITIGEDVLIGARVTILRGAVIGAGASVAAGSVVSGEVAPGARVAGVPARVINLAAAGGEAPAPVAAPSLDAAGTAMIQERVRQVVARTFSLGDLPALTAGPHDVEGWDSLGVLALMLNLEEEFGISLSEQDILEMRSIQTASGVVSRYAGARG